MTNNLKTNKQGFSAVEFIIILAVLIVLVVVGYGVWHRHNNKVTATTSNVALQPTTTDGPGAETVVKKFFAQYATDTTAPSQQATIQQYGTTALVNSYGEAGSNQAFFCTASVSAVVPTTFSVSKDIVTVTAHPATGTTPVFTINVVNDGGLKIDAISC